MKKVLNFLKIFCGCICIIECFVGIAITASIHGTEKIAGIIAVAIFAFLAFLCFKKPKNRYINTNANHVRQTGNNNAETGTGLSQTPSIEAAALPTSDRPIPDEEVPYFIQLGYEQVLQAQRESVNPKFHRTSHEEELSFNFAMKYENQVNIYTDKFESLYKSAHYTNNLNQRISMLKQAEKIFKKAKRFCYSKGKGGKIYFQDMWEYLHNSRKDCYSYLDMIQDSLNQAIYLKINMIPRILNTITKHNGILQKDIYILLPDIDKEKLQRVLKKLDDDRIISRIRRGNSYELHVL